VHARFKNIAEHMLTRAQKREIMDFVFERSNLTLHTRTTGPLTYIE